MLTHFFKVIFRFLVRSRFFATLNILGLAVGIASAIVVFTYVRSELSYDAFHSDGENIYRVIRQSRMNGATYPIGVTSGPYAPALQQDFENEIDDVVRAMPFDALVQHEEKSFIEERLLLADSNFFQFFSYPLAKGEAATVLANANNMVVSTAFARKYFGDADPIGKMLRVDGSYDFVVTGILGENPGNTHLQFDMVASLAVVEREEWFHGWWNNSLGTYVKIASAEKAKQVEARLPQFMDKYFGEDFKRVGNRIDLVLEPLRDIYFNNDTRYETSVLHGNARYVVIFGSVGILLVLLATINYMNLATAQAQKRAKEVGIRKTLGSARSRIAAQFLTEAFMLTAASLVLALLMVQLSGPFFESNFGVPISGTFRQPSTWALLGGVLVVVTLLSGSYPSFMLASFKPVNVLKGEVRGDFQYVFLRKVLVVFQFGISGFMIIATLLIGRQLQFMREKDLGFDHDHTLVIHMNNQALRDQREAFKQQLLRRKDVQQVSSMTGYPSSGFFDATTVKVEGIEETARMRTLYADEDLVPTLGLTVVAGRAFSHDFTSDRDHAVMLNETAVKDLGWEPSQAVGKRVQLMMFDSTYKQVVGIVRDYHFTSLKNAMEPLIITCSARGEMVIKLDGSNLVASMQGVEGIWNSFQTGYPLEAQFLDEHVNQLYQAEIRQGKIFSVFAGLSVFIACLGIFGLTTFMATQRKKEIGIRKILGASVSQVSGLLMKDLLWLVVMANVIAIPLAYWGIDTWLSGFAYRTEMPPLLFVSGAVTVLLIAALITSIRAIQTAIENPVKSLRTE